MIKNIRFRLLDETDGTNGSIVGIDLNGTRFTPTHTLDSRTRFDCQRLAVQAKKKEES